MGADAQVGFIDFAAGENQGAGKTVDLMVADNHKNFQTVWPIPQQKHRCRVNEWFSIGFKLVVSHLSILFALILVNDLARLPDFGQCVGVKTPPFVIEQKISLR
jgi:hypothetical protein